VWCDVHPAETARGTRLNVVTRRLLRTGWSLPFAKMLAPRRSVTLLYHGVPSYAASGITGAVLEQHVLFLKQHFTLVSPQDMDRTRQSSDTCRVALTFDDGFRNNVEVVAPILRKHHVPALFFVPSRHAAPGKYLWFSYLRAVEEHFPASGFSFRGMFFDMSSAGRPGSIRRLREILLGLQPHPAAMYDAIENELPRLEEFVPTRELMDWFCGMTTDQIAELATDPLFTLGSHTADHPLLTRCPPQEAIRQVQENKAWLEQVTQRPCSTIAYPGGDYNNEILDACRELGFERGYATTPASGRDWEFEIPRMGIYSASIEALGFKIQWGSVMRSLGMKVG
jgi:peptidoglycan/xylan/chitin deacetylase (PgdA/CDA1 family)